MKVRDRFDKNRIGDLVCDGAYKYVQNLAVEIDGKRVAEYDSLDGVFEDWEDYEEPEAGYIIDPMEEDCVSADDSGYEESDVERAKEVGLWFETEEEAEKAVEKLKAWKRLKDKGFRFITHIDRDNTGQGVARYEWDGYVNGEDLDLLFGGEE